ncbi:MAG: CHRD domain-containing protein [Bryobacterales bacterium]|nr:CHRD domain-containing protein [Bryobacterales bacterium]
MRSVLSTLVFGCALLSAQTAEVQYFVADMRASNEVPAVETTDNAGAVLVAHVVRDAQGRVVSGTVDFILRATFAAESNVTGLHIHTGAAGTNGAVVIDSGVRGAEPVTVPTGTSFIQYSGQVKPDNAAAVAALAGVLANPNAYYVNLHTSVSPGGRFRGQLYRAESRTFMAVLSSQNEVPPISTAATGGGAFHALRAFDANGRYVMGAGFFTSNFNFGSQQRLTGWHLHRGIAGANGSVVLDSGLTAAQQVDTAENGTGALQRVMTYQPDNAAAASALTDIFDNSGGFYMNIHSTTNPGGFIRGQMIPAERIVTSVNMSTANEVPALTLDAGAPAAIWADMVRTSSGDVGFALLTYSVNHRFPEAATFTGLHIHEGAAGANGPVRLDSGLSGANNVASADGFGNITRSFLVSSETGLTALNGLLANPEGFYLNLHTTVNPSGAVRAQVAPASARRPAIIDFISGVSDPASKTAAQGGLMTVFGADLFKVPANPTTMTALSERLNGSSVTVGGKAARIWYMGRDLAGNPPDFMVIQVPFDAPTGPQDVVVANSNGAGAPFRTTVAATAPALFFDGQGAIALRQDLTLVRPDSPARAGDAIGLIATGLGQTTPAMANGQIATDSAATAAQVSATVGGRPAVVVAAQSAPGYAGVYIVGILVPTGVPAGNAATQIRIGDVASNTVQLPVR